MMKRHVFSENWFVLELAKFVLVLMILGMSCAPSVAQKIDMGFQAGSTDSISAWRTQAIKHRQDQNWKAAVHASQTVVNLDANSLLDWYYLGYAHSQLNQWDEAIAAYSRAAESPRFVAAASYNIGCAYALKGDSDRAFEYLYLAIDERLRRMELLTTDEDLNDLRKDPRFKKMLSYADGERLEFDIEALIGDWRILRGYHAGREIPRYQLPAQLSFSKDELTFPGESDPTKTKNIGISIDDVSLPAAIDLSNEAGSKPLFFQKDNVVGIVKTHGSRMTLCYDPQGKNRPTRFGTDRENGFVVMLCQKRQTSLEPVISRMTGSWKIVSGKVGGKELSAEGLGRTVMIDDASIVMPAGPNDPFVISYVVNSKKSPIAIDMRIEKGAAPENSVAVGIIDVEEDTLTLCYDTAGKSRPKSFDRSGNKSFAMFKLERVKSEDQR